MDKTYAIGSLADLPPETALSEYLEERINGIISDSGVQHVFVREIACLPKVFTLSKVLQEFLRKFQVPTHFPYTSRFIMCFQTFEKGCVMFFAICVQEYDSACPLPNQNMVYIAMLDSAQLFKPSCYRRDVYYVILMAYLQYLAEVGFENVFLWSCPPQPNEEYIFYRRPKCQQNLTPSMLSDWYTYWMEAAVKQGVLKSYSTLYEWCPKTSLVEFFYSKFPYFYEDHWPQELEETIESLRSNTDYDGETVIISSKIVSKSINSPSAKSSRISLSKYDYVMKEIISVLKRNKISFYVMTLNRNPSPKVVTNLYTPSHFTGSRVNVLNYLQTSCPGLSDHHQALLTTKKMLARMQKSWSYIFCDVCTNVLINGIWCETCNFDVCVSCIEKKYIHEHFTGGEVKWKSNSSVLPDIFTSKTVEWCDYETWRSAKARWWSDFQNMSINYKTVNVFKIVAHIQSCTRTLCSDCMRFRDLVYFHGSSQLPPNGTSRRLPAQLTLLKFMALFNLNNKNLHPSANRIKRRKIMIPSVPCFSSAFRSSYLSVKLVKRKKKLSEVQVVWISN